MRDMTSVVLACVLVSPVAKIAATPPTGFNTVFNIYPSAMYLSQDALFQVLSIVCIGSSQWNSFGCEGISAAVL
jgi:hypothetical protein